MNDFRERIERLSPKRLGLLALELKSRLDALERNQSEPLAVVGAGCHIPQAGTGIQSFWELLAAATDAVSQVPQDRWDASAWYDADQDAPGRISTTWGSFVSGVDHFDAPFFNISAREAASMDPQQRILLESCWQALENAGHSPRSLHGSSTGVFLGLTNNDYHAMLLARGEQLLDTYVATGVSPSVAAGRISYFLGFHGPALVVDTACSGSLVALHLACQSLRRRECNLALAGGVNLILSPDITTALSRAHMMAPDGHCKTFDARANGFVRGEGCGVVVLKRLSDAEGDGDHVLGLVRGTAVNQDGRSSGLTAPNGVAQESLLRQALRDAGLTAGDIDYIEAHGTGTSLGDPIEAHALAAVFGPGRGGQPLVVGSVKTNLGHLEAAAGIAGVLKTVLSLEQEHIPRHLHFRSMNPHIDWGELSVEIPVEGRSWPRGERVRRAGVSSFGFSGTNAHVIVEEAPLPVRRQGEWRRPYHLLALSARTPAALEELTERYRKELEGSRAEVGDICFTANAGRTHFEERSFYVGEDVPQLLASLRGAGVRGRKEGAPAVAFLFSGQGAQYAGMGRELYDSQPVFRGVLDQCAEILRGELGEPLLEVLWGRRSELLGQTAYTQPALFAVEYGLAQLWRSWGVEPAMVAGHSVGEYVAACVAGVYGLEAGLQLIAARGRLMQACAGEGVMSAVRASEARVSRALSGMESRVSLGAVNAPESVVLSGYRAEVEAVEQRLQAEGIQVKRLAVSHGFHSPQMEEMQARFAELAERQQYAAPAVKWISAMTGRLVPSQSVDAHYWREQVRQPVRWAQAMAAMEGENATIYLEVGPGTTLAGLGRQCVEDTDRLWLPSLRSSRGEWQQILDSLGNLYTRGSDIDWLAYDKHYLRRRVPLPTYPFQAKHYWAENIERRIPKQPASEPLANWFYQLSWDSRPASGSVILTRTPHTEINQRWLLVPDSGGVATEFASLLEGLGGSSRMANAEQAPALIASDQFDGVLYLSALDCQPPSKSASDSAPSAALAHGAEILQLIHAVIKTRSKLSMVTRGAQVIGAETELNIAQAAVWGWAKTISLEHPDSAGRCIDLDPSASDQESARTIVEAVFGDDLGNEDQVAIRGGARYVPRLQRALPPVHCASPLVRDKIYLITGGLGGIGLRLARWMAQRGARRLILAGRTALPDRATWDSLSADSPAGERISAMREIESFGAEVSVRAVDICDPQQIAKLFASLPGELGGILHLAAGGEMSSLTSTTSDGMRDVMVSKTLGTWNLHVASRDLPLDFFVMFSSWACILGAQDLGHYNAANQFIDAVAHYRKSLALPATSINWGAWDVIRNASAELQREYERSGMGSLQSDAAFTAMYRAAAAGTTQMIVADVDWERLKPLYETRRPRPILESVSNLSEPASVTLSVSRETVVNEPDADQSTEGIDSPRANIRAEILACPTGERIQRLESYVTSVLAKVIGTPDEQLSPDTATDELGLDSLMALEARNRINSELEISISTARFLQGLTIAELAARIASELPAATAERPSNDRGTPSGSADPIDDSFPLSFSQRSQWLVQKVVPDSYTLNCAFTAKAAPFLQFDRFEQAVWKLMERHAALRTVIVETDEGEPRQRVLTSWRGETILIDAAAVAEEKLADIVTREFQRALDIQKSMLRISVFRRSNCDIILFVFHHLVVDGTSIPLCLRELGEFYMAELTGTPPLLPAVKASHREFVEWEAELVNGPGFQRLWEFWKDELSGDLPLLTLPLSRPRLPAFLIRGERVFLEFDRDLTSAIHDAARQLKTTTFAFLLSAYQILLCSYSGQDDLVVGTSSSSRDLAKWDNTVGCLVNIVPVRCRLSGNETFAEHLSHTRETLLRTLDHQGIPFSLLVERLRIRRDLGCPPLFQAFFNYLTDRPGNLGRFLVGMQDASVPFGSSVLCPWIELTHHELQADAMMYIADFSEEIYAYLAYNADVVDGSVAQSLAEDYIAVIRAVVANLNQPISRLPIRSFVRQETEPEELLL